MPDGPILVWFRNDLRLADHPALSWAAAQRRPLIPVFLWSPEEEGAWAPGAASRVALAEILSGLDEDLRAQGLRLILRRGPADEALGRLAAESRASAVCWNLRYEPAARAQEARAERALSSAGIETKAFPGGLLHEPEVLRTRGGGPYQVFTPFYRALLDRLQPDPPLPRPRRTLAPRHWPRGLRLAELQLAPAEVWTEGIRDFWRFGERDASRRLAGFLREGVAAYGVERDRLDRDSTSRLSLALHSGLLSPQQVWSACRALSDEDAPRAERITSAGIGSRAGRAAHGGRPPRAAAHGAEAFLRQLCWREFAHHLLWHFPATPTAPLRPEFAAFPWTRDRRARDAWRRGRTGYPVVDAGMRQLWQTGWMHNRARLIAASFLVKDLLLPWGEGARWFWDTLADADLANNTLGWQWTAGCGADAAPYFRVFNPILQGRRFDPEGNYVRRYVPELAALPARHIHAPWEAPPAVLVAARVTLGRTYPRPIVDHDEARERALDALAEMQARARGRDSRARRR